MAEVNYTVEPNYHAIYDEYMADVVQGNKRRRALSVQRVDPNQPALSAEAEVLRQTKAIDSASRRANTSETNTNAPQYEIEPAPDSAPTFEIEPAPGTNVNETKGVSKIPQFRQGSTTDVQVRPSLREATLNDSKPEDYRRLGVKPPDDSPSIGERIESHPWFKALGTGVTSAMDAYEHYIAGPYRRAMFKEDPLETMAKRAPGPDAPLDEGLWHAAKTVGVGLLADPSVVLGVSGLGSIRPRRLPQRTLVDPHTYDRPIGPGKLYEDLHPAEVQRPPEPMGSYSGEFGARSANVMTPESIAYSAETPQVRRTGTGRYVLPTGEAPSISDLARQHFETQQLPPVPDFQSARPFVYADEGLRRDLGGESTPLAGYRGMRPFDTEEGPLNPGDLSNPLTTGARISPETHVFETPGFLRTGEEMVAGRSRIPAEKTPPHGSQVPPIRETQSITLPRRPAEGIQSELDLAARQAQLEMEQQAIKSQSLAEQESQDFARDYVKQIQNDRTKIAKNAIDQASALPTDPPSPELLLMQQPGQAGPKVGPVQIPGAKTNTQQNLPKLRALQHAYDVLDSLGDFSKRLGSILRYTWDYSEQGTKRNFLDYSALVENLFGPQKLSNRVKTWKQTGQMGDLLNTSAKDFGLTQNQIDALVELHEVGQRLPVTGGITPQTIESLVSPTAWAKLKTELLDPRIHRLFQEGWQIATGRASSLPSVQAKGMIYDPITGERFPVGAPSPYWPHQAVGKQTREILTNELLRKIWLRGRYEEKGIDFDLFKEKFPEWWESKPEIKAITRDTADEIRMRKFAGLEYKRFIDMLDDAKSHNRTVAESLRHYGYETDPLRMLTRHNLFALKRGATLEHQDEIRALMKQLELEYGEGEAGKQTYNWIKTVVDRTQGVSRREDLIDQTNNIWRIAQSIAYPAFLKGSWKQNFLLQPNYAMLQTGLKPVIDSVWKYMGAKLGWSDAKILEAAQRSGADFPAFLTEHHAPDGPWEQYSKTALEWDLFSPSDRWTRNQAALAETGYFPKIVREFWKDPANPEWKGLLEKRNINPNELYKELAAQPKEQWVDGIPQAPEKYLLRAMQVTANRSMGRTGIRGMQAWASGDTEVSHVMLMLKRQILSNEGMLVDSILKAPTAGDGIKRALTFLVGAEAAGLMYNGVVNWLVGNNFLDVNKSMVKTFGGNKEAALAAKALLMGMGTFTSGIVLSGLQAMGGNKAAPAYAFMSPAIASLVDEGVNKALHGDVVDPAMRMQPSEAVQNLYRRHQDKQRRRNQGGDSITSPGMRVP